MHKTQIDTNSWSTQHAGGLPRYAQQAFATLLAAAAMIGTVLPTGARAEGFRNPPAGAFNLGRAGGRIAHVDDSSAVAQNPANLLDLSRPEFQLTPTLVNISAEFKSPTGQEAETTDPWKMLPNVFVSVPLVKDKLACGLGVTVPYGLSNEWDDETSAFAKPTGVFRYQSTYFAELQTLNFNPALALKLGDSLQLGAGLDIMWSELTFKRYYPWFLLTQDLATPDGHADAVGDGVGFGGNLGLTWQIADRHRLAVTYRSPISVSYDGDFSIDNFLPAASYVGASPESDFSTKIEFPTIVAVGYGIKLTKSIRLEADFEWLQFSNFDRLDLDVGNNAVLFPSGTKIKEDWKDTFTVGIAGDWRFAPGWVVRAGYQFYESPVPDSTFSPTIPDANQNVITVGLGYRYKGHAFELAYGYDFYDERNIKNNQTPEFNGDYDITVHMFSFAYRFSF